MLWFILVVVMHVLHGRYWPLRRFRWVSSWLWAGWISWRLGKVIMRSGRACVRGFISRTSSGRWGRRCRQVWNPYGAGVTAGRSYFYSAVEFCERKSGYGSWWSRVGSTAVRALCMRRSETELIAYGSIGVQPVASWIWLLYTCINSSVYKSQSLDSQK